MSQQIIQVAGWKIPRKWIFQTPPPTSAEQRRRIIVWLLAGGAIFGFWVLRM